MLEIEKFVTEKEMRSELLWLSTQDAKEQHDIPNYMIYRWGPALEREGLARKLGGGRGYWLIAPEAVPFLQGRRGKIGRPREKKDGT